jgi:hemerythrin-like domain-containing protein
MTPTNILRNEHKVIKAALACLHEMTVRIQAGQRVEIQDIREMLDFIRNFADGCHHFKEEKVLFPAMGLGGFPEDAGPISVMLHEHEVGRSYVRSMAEAVDRAEQGDSEGITPFLAPAQGYIALLENHIYKEDNILFPMAERALGEDKMEEVLEDFKRHEKEEMGDGTHQKYLDFIAKLTDKYGIGNASVAI